MKLNRSETFKYVHTCLRQTNVAYLGGYRKAFGDLLRKINAQGGLVRSWSV